MAASYLTMTSMVPLNACARRVYAWLHDILSSKCKYTKFSLKAHWRIAQGFFGQAQKDALCQSLALSERHLLTSRNQARHCFLSSSVSLENRFIDIWLKGESSLGHLWWRCWKGKPVNTWAQPSPPGTSKGIGLYCAAVFFYPLAYWKSRGRPLNIYESSIVLSEVGKMREMESKLPGALLCSHRLLCGRVNRWKEKKSQASQTPFSECSR